MKIKVLQPDEIRAIVTFYQPFNDHFNAEGLAEMFKTTPEHVLQILKEHKEKKYVEVPS